jgi:uncharacterized protein YukE
MAYFKSYDSSDVSKAIAKVAADAAGRLKTVEADVKRIKPKLGQYKKETLDKLIKETNKAGSMAWDAAFDKISTLATSYKNELDTLKKQLLAAEQKRFEDATVAAIETEYKVNLEGVDGDHNDLLINPNNAKRRLAEAYDELVALFESELKKAKAERQPSADRKI